MAAEVTECSFCRVDYALSEQGTLKAEAQRSSNVHSYWSLLSGERGLNFLPGLQRACTTAGLGATTATEDSHQQSRHILREVLILREFSCFCTAVWIAVAPGRTCGVHNTRL